jgi:hypothetical protein
VLFFTQAATSLSSDFLVDLWVVDLFEQICASTQVSVPNPVSRANSFFIVIWS